MIYLPSSVKSYRYNFLGILQVYQQLAREKTNPETHLKSHLEMPEEENDLRGRERYTKALKKIYLVIKKELQTSLKDLNSPLKNFLN